MVAEQGPAAVDGDHGSVAGSARGGASSIGMGEGIQDRVLQIAEELGRYKCELVGKLIALGYQEGETPMSMREAAEKSDEEVPRDRFARLLDYWSMVERIGIKEDAMRVMRKGGSEGPGEMA